MANATTIEEETGMTAEGRTAGNIGSTGNFNVAPQAPAAPAPATYQAAAVQAAPAAPTPAPAAIIPAAGGAELNFLGQPANARPGECYGQVTIPAVKKTVSEQILVAPADKKLAEIIPAKYDTVTETIIAQEESEELITIPAKYKTVTETVVVKPASTRIVPVPAKYDTVTEQVLVAPATTMWKKGVGGAQSGDAPTRIDSASGEVMCLVEVPAQYKTITKRVLVSPETTREEAVPAVTKQVTRRVVAEKARVETRKIPAVTKQITKRVLVEPEKPVFKDIPAQFKTVNKQVLVSPEQVTWSRILCKTNADAQTVAQIQSALKQAGYNPGNTDGVLGAQTYNAVNRFQRDNNLHRGEITYETLKALGLSAS
jgi:hypothetical protein